MRSVRRTPGQLNDRRGYLPLQTARDFGPLTQDIGLETIVLTPGRRHDFLFARRTQLNAQQLLWTWGTRARRHTQHLAIGIERHGLVPRLTVSQSGIPRPGGAISRGSGCVCVGTQCTHCNTPPNRRKGATEETALRSEGYRASTEYPRSPRHHAVPAGAGITVEHFGQALFVAVYGGEVVGRETLACRRGRRSNRRGTRPLSGKLLAEIVLPLSSYACRSEHGRNT